MSLTLSIAFVFYSHDYFASSHALVVKNENEIYYREENLKKTLKEFLRFWIFWSFPISSTLKFKAHKNKFLIYKIARKELQDNKRSSTNRNSSRSIDCFCGKENNKPKKEGMSP